MMRLLSCTHSYFIFQLNFNGKGPKLCSCCFVLFINIYEGGSESSVIGVITLLIYMIGCCIIP